MSCCKISRSFLIGLAFSLAPSLCASLVLGQEGPLYGPQSPPPLGVVETFLNGSPGDGDIGRAGGELMTFEYVVLASMTSVWWSPLADEVKLSLDGPEYSLSEIMEFEPILSDLASGVILWQGVTTLCTSSTTVYTRCIMTVREEDGVTPVSLVYPADLELPASIGGIIPVPGTDEIQVRLEMFASLSSDTGFQPHLDFFDYYVQEYQLTGCTDQAFSSFRWGYYWEGLAPSLVTNDALVLDEGTTETITSALLSAEDIESSTAGINFTVAPNVGDLPPSYGTLYLDSVPLGAGDTFTQEDLDGDLVTYVHDGSETQNDGFPFTCQDEDGQLASDGPYTVFYFSITINPVNDPPVAFPDTFVIDMEQTFADTLQAVDPDSPLVFELTESGELGTASLIDINLGVFQYTANLSTAGVDTLRFQAIDSEYTSNEATVLIFISDLPPVAIDGSGVTLEDVPFEGTLAGSDPYSPQLTFSIENNGSLGSAVVTDSALGTFTYTPNDAAFGIDTFTFLVDDGLSMSEPGTFTVTIRPNLDIGDVVIADGGSNAIVLQEPGTNRQAIIASGNNLAEVRGIDLSPGQDLFVVDSVNGVILVDHMTGNQTVHCDPENFTTEPVGPWGLACEATSSYLVADGPAGILRVDIDTGVATVLTSGGLMFLPLGICVNSTGDIYVADPGIYIGETNQILHIDPDSGAQTVVSSGNDLQLPLYITVEDSDHLLVSDGGSLVGGQDQVVRITISSGAQQVLTVGDLLDFPGGLGVTDTGGVFVASSNNSSVVEVDLVTGDQVLFAQGAPLSNPSGLLVVQDAATAVRPTPDLPSTFALLPAAPNPFNPSTALGFDLPAPGRINFGIFDATGRLVRTLMKDEHRAAGRHVLVWDGRNDRGRTLASGLYFYRVEAGRMNATGKMVLLK